MATVQWRPEVNALTVPQSCKIRYVSRDSIDTDGLSFTGRLVDVLELHT